MPSRYRFSDVLIDLDAREIHRAGRRVEVEAKVFDLIALLLANRERAMDKRELNATLWGDRPVTDAALSQQLRKARRALGDDGHAQRVIRTVHGRGLRWVAEVVEGGSARENGAHDMRAASDTTPATPRRGRLRLLLALGALAALLVAAGSWWFAPQRTPAPRGLRVAVLPLQNNSGEASLDWTRNGLMGLMASLFAQHGDVEVVAPAAVLAVAAGTPADAQAAQALRRSLGATHLVGARLRRIGALYQLDLSLLAAGAATREESLHASAPAPLAVDAVKQARRWLALDTPAGARDRGISNPFLAEAYARGVDAQLHGDQAAARKYFEVCLDQDPGLAWPRLGLAVAQGATGDAARSAENARTVAAAARESGDEELLVGALRQLASLAFRRGDFEGASKLLDAAIGDVGAERPLLLTDLLVAQASIADEHGDFARSRRLFGRALALARETGNRRGEALVLVNQASLENGAGDAAAASALLRAGLDAAREAGDASIEANTLANLGGAEANQGRLLDAAALLWQARAVALRRNDTRVAALTGVQLIWVLAPFGRDEATGRLAQEVALAARDNPYLQAELHWALGGLAARREDWPLALEELGHARARYDGLGNLRNSAPVLAAIVEVAVTAGRPRKAHAAADAFRAIAASEPEAWNAWLPLIEAQLRKVDGDRGAAIAALVQQLDGSPDAGGPAAQATLFQLGRWQVESGASRDLLERAAWQPWLREHPDAIALHAKALRQAGRVADADAEQARLDRLEAAPQLDPPDGPA